MITTMPRSVTASQVNGAHGGPGARLRHIVHTAIERRKLLRAFGKGKPVNDAVEQAMGRLWMWMWRERNPFPSEATVKAFALADDVALVMPSTAEGRNLLNELRQLVQPH